MPFTQQGSYAPSPRVSVLMRTQNRPALLARAVTSVVNQTFAEWELIVVNDAGDRASSQRVLDALPERAQRQTRLIFNEVSHGMEAATNTAFAASRGEFIAILDDDDTWEPEFLERTVAYLDAHSDLLAVATRADLVIEHLDDQGNPIEDERQAFATDYTSWNLPDLLTKNYVPINSELVRAEAARAVGGWDESLLTQGDWDFSLRLLARGPVGFIEGEPLAHWHHRRDAAGVCGNSIFVSANRHVADNLTIRERYLRAAVFRDDERPALGSALQSALYYQRLLDESQRQNAALHEALSQVIAHMDQRFALIEERLWGPSGAEGPSMADLRDSIEEMRVTLAALTVSVESLAPRAVLGRIASAVRRRR